MFRFKFNLIRDKTNNILATLIAVCMFGKDYCFVPAKVCSGFSVENPIVYGELDISIVPV